MPSTKYFTLPTDQLTERIARELALEMIKAKIWVCILTQSGQYRGLKVGINNKREFTYFKGTLGLIKEQHKVLKQDKFAPVSQSDTQVCQSVIQNVCHNVTQSAILSDKDQLSLLFPDS